MKKIFLSTVVILLLLSCSKDNVSSDEDSFDLNQEQILVSKGKCGSMEALQNRINQNPELIQKMEAIERHTASVLIKGRSSKIPVNDVIEIPVVFHVIYRTTSENIPTSQLQDQIDILNEDFNLKNPGRSTIPDEFKDVEADIGIRFVLEDVIRVRNNRKNWTNNNLMKFTADGGSDAVNPKEFLNIWVVNKMKTPEGLDLGYAQFPGDSFSTDGVVLYHKVVGYTTNYSGRTATHEVGHWLNLKHIWGDVAGCGGTDFVADTPDAFGPSINCPTYPQFTCNSNDMTMNFMDYSDDKCTNMFTEGQKARMLALFEDGGFRASMAD